MKAQAPGRSTGSLVIGFGMVSVPVAVYAGVETDAAKIKRNWRVADGQEVGYITVNKGNGEVVARSDIYDVYTCEDGTEVPLTDEEIAKALGEENGNASVVGFYPAEQVSEYVAENILQVRPKKAKGKKNPFEKPFAVLMSAMESTGTFALLSFTLRGKPSLGTLDFHGNLRVVKWENEVREELPMPEVEVSEAEANMAVALVESLRGEQAPQMPCEAVEKVREYAETKKVAMGTGKPVPAPEVSQAEQVTDLLAALDASVKAVKKTAKPKKKAKVKA